MAASAAAPHADYRDPGGTWIDDPGFDAIIDTRSAIDEAMWS